MTGKRVLIIEDDQAITDVLYRLTEEMGFAACKTSGIEAEATYKNFQPDIIILDILMPEKDGVDILLFLEREHSSSRVIIISGSPSLYRKMTENLGEAIGINIVASIAKPFRLHELRAVLSETALSLQAS